MKRKIWVFATYATVLALLLAMLSVFTLAYEEEAATDDLGVDEIFSADAPVEAFDDDLSYDFPEQRGSADESKEDSMHDNSPVSGEESAAGNSNKPESPLNEGMVLDVLIPSSINFTLDPFEIAGRGSVYSDDFLIENFGGTDVLLKFTDITVTYANDGDFLPLSEPFYGDAAEQLKAVFLLVDFGRPEAQSVVATALDPETQLPSLILHAPGSGLSTSCVLSISGSINPFPAQLWSSGDVRINLAFSLEVIDTQEEPEEEEETENSQAQGLVKIIEEPEDTEDDEADTDETGAGETDAGETGAGEADAGETDTGETGTGETDTGETGTGETSAGETGAGETSAGETGAGETSAGETDTGETGTGETGAGETGAGETGTGETGAGETGAGETGAGETGTGETGTGETGAGETSAGETSAGETGTGETGAGETGAGETSAGVTSAGETGTGETGVGESS